MGNAGRRISNRVIRNGASAIDPTLQNAWGIAINPAQGIIFL